LNDLKGQVGLEYWSILKHLNRKYDIL